MRLVQSSGASAALTTADPALVRLLIKARAWWAKLAGGELDITTLAAAEGTTRSYIARVVRLTFLAPDIVEAILAGKQRASVNVEILTSTGVVEID